MITINKICNFVAVICLVAPVVAFGSDKPAAPYANPFLADSAYPMIHGRANFTPLAGPVGPSRRLASGDYKHVKLGLLGGWVPVYSSPYPNGKRVIWVGGHDRVAKLDADTLAVLTTHGLGGATFLGEEEIERYIAEMDKLDDKARADYGLELLAEPFRSVESNYHLLTSDNEFYLPHRAPDGSVSLQVYGEADHSDPASKIRLLREWKLSSHISNSVITSVNITSDGWVVMGTQDGALVALSRDFKSHYILQLPRKEQADNYQDFWVGFMRNGIVTDDRGGIFVVTRDYMHRVQWTGEKLSLEEKDGGWSAPYPNETGLGSGTTPALMGWGKGEDHLVVIADASSGNNQAVAFWRDAIPDDWQGIPGYDRRIAGVTAIRFGVADNEVVQIENTPVVYGYGAFFNNTKPVQPLPSQGSPTRQWMAESFYMRVPGHEARGGAKVHWDATTRKLSLAWQSQTNFVSTVCTISSATELLYCWGARKGEWTMEATNWSTGVSAFHYVLGASQRFNPLGGPVIISPDGEVECGCGGGLGIVRIR